MTEASLTKALDKMPAAERKVAEALANRARSATKAIWREKLPHSVDNAVNVGEMVGGGLLGWGLELGTRALVNKLAQPAADGSLNTFAKYPDYYKAGASLVVGGVGLIANVAMPGSVEMSMPRRIAAQASVTQIFFGADRALTKLLNLPK